MILLYSIGDIENKDVESIIRDSFGKEGIYTDIIVIKGITKEDEKLSKKYNISLSKASYINSILKDNKNIDVKALINNTVSELTETKNTGFYCDSGYIIDGSHCLKEISRESASTGEVCPRNYTEYNGVCYEEKGYEETNELICREGFTLNNDKCINTIEMDAEVEYSCSKGELVRDPKGLKKGVETPICVDKSSGVKPTLRCLSSSYHIVIDGKCYNGPAPTIDGGCPNGDTLVNGGCYSKDDEDQWVCTDGGIYHKSQDSVPEFCPETLTYIEPNIVKYSCQKDFKLKDNICIKEEIEEARHKNICTDGYTEVDGRCINYNNKTDKVNGYKCDDENARLKGNMCITYSSLEAKHN